jgi:hypothetical protein
MTSQTQPRPSPIALRIELQSIVPLIWRRIVVPNSWTLAALHGYLQWVMGWQDSHAHEFHVDGKLIAPAWWLEEISADMDISNCRDERRVSVAVVATELGVGGSFEYHYDMGDGWIHQIVVESPAVGRADVEFPLPRCAAGENACPPEDVGGPHGYKHFLDVIADRDHEEHLDTLRWIGGVFDPAGFDLNRLNRDWRGPKRKRSV